MSAAHVWHLVLSLTNSDGTKQLVNMLLTFRAQSVGFKMLLHLIIENALAVLLFTYKSYNNRFCKNCFVTIHNKISNITNMRQLVNNIENVPLFMP